jgi:GcrA cell cycle regulator
MMGVASSQKFDWTAERVDVLRAMWADKSTSASMIARELGGGVTRSAVIGKARRLGLQSKLNTDHVRLPRQPRRNRNHGVSIPGSSPGTRRRVRSMLRGGQRGEELPVAVAPPPVAPMNLGLLALGLRFDQCREVTGRGHDGLATYCGHRAERGPFCAYHGALNYESVVERRRRRAA